MLALLLAAQLTAASPAVQLGSQTKAAPMPNVYQTPARCASADVKVVDRYGRPVLRNLNTLPMAALQLAVDRRIDGCRVVTVVYGQVAPDNPNPPAEGYGVKPLDEPGRRR